ncbi:undecaprenyl-diphosphate phosphatase [Anaerococcus lactolyticus]|uniref:Undecaprenyl-diphosphatase n=1 Tax=Anaerococcus lactolyticus S7-1-13 TaxID=1284686 RepID=A0A095X005_9FIRM|nr:undecaprenyl-diphosphate phosphatase [Anaerococcus lactolyticus]KGF03380.1 UDP pyrophosphate phosphatase [Anaerococcus lactolyticus S7-1-13]
MIINLIKVLILSLVEGITEFLPVSSTGHLILVNQFVKLEPEGFSNAFNVIIQLGAILSVVVIYFEKLNPWAKSKQELPKKYKDLNAQSKAYYLATHPDKTTINLWLKVIVGVLPAMVLGLLFDDLIDAYLFNPTTVAAMLLLWGIIIIFIEKKNKTIKYDSLKDVPYTTIIMIGLFQCLAMVPGTSRSAATIIGAMILGLSRPAAAEFSFFLAIPTMLGATLLKLIKNLGDFTGTEWTLILLGMILSFIVAFIVIKQFLAYVKKHDFIPFGIYRIILAVVVFVYFLLINR